jgi:alanine dehydrogenase
MADVIDAIETAFRQLARGNAVVPERGRLDLPEGEGVVLQMPAFLNSHDSTKRALGTKIVSVFEGNTARGLDLIQSIYLLLDSQTGEPRALMGGRFITGIRTAATSAVATKFMASSGKKKLAVFGSGVQARFHIEAMTKVADVEAILISSRNRVTAQALADFVRTSWDLPCEVVDAATAAATANLICTCTSSPVPLFEGSSVRNDVHINAVGAFTPETREVDGETVKRARVIIDAESAAGREAGEILIPIAEGLIDSSHVKGSLADLVTGKIVGRELAAEISLFKSCGLALEDLVTAQLAFNRSRVLGVGTSVPI